VHRQHYNNLLARGAFHTGFGARFGTAREPLPDHERAAGLVCKALWFGTTGVIFSNIGVTAWQLH